MIRIVDSEISLIVCKKSVSLHNNYYYYECSNGSVMVPFGDFVEVYSSFEDFDKNCF